MHRVLRFSVLALVLIVVSASASGCEGDGEGDESETSRRPLRPLVYTERPELSSEAAAVRERRLMRQLLEGASDGGAWGSLERREPESFPSTDTPEAFGEALFEAMVDRDEAQWDHLFVSPREWAAMVNLERRQAREFVDEQQAKSSKAWEVLAPEASSEAREGGFSSILSFEGLELGEGRTVGGKRVEEDEPAVQFWNNRLRLRFRDTDVVFEFLIPKIVRVTGATGGRLRVASEIRHDEDLGVLRATGIHLKPQLLRSREYPYPLEVGNFWRYRRSRGEPSQAEKDPLEAGLETSSLATEVLTEVVSVDRYETIRLVGLRRSYNDPDLTRDAEWWVITPRRIYVCTRACRSHVRDVDWMLEYFGSHTPIYQFPLRPGTAWGEGGRTEVSQSVYEVESADAVEVSAGVFEAVVDIVGQGPLGAYDGRLRVPQTRTFSPGRGLIRRQLSPADGAPIFEELAEYRVMP